MYCESSLNLALCQLCRPGQWSSLNMTVHGHVVLCITSHSSHRLTAWIQNWIDGFWLHGHSSKLHATILGLCCNCIHTYCYIIIALYCDPRTLNWDFYSQGLKHYSIFNLINYWFYVLIISCQFHGVISRDYDSDVSFKCYLVSV